MTQKRQAGAAARAGIVLVGTLAVTTACVDLSVPNLIEPDRERALGNPSDAEAFIGASFFPSFFRPLHGTDGGLSALAISLWTYGSADMTATMSGTNSAVWYLDIDEPRREHNNAATICSTICEWGPRDYWVRISSASSIPYDGLRLLDTDVVIQQGGQDVTPRARAFAKFMQGWSWGYAALIFDRVNVVPESLSIPESLAELQEFSVSTLLPYDEAIEAAVASLEEAMAIARAYPTVVTYPIEEAGQSIPWFASSRPVTNAQFIQMANTLAARLLVIGARNPQERANVDWQRVLRFTEAGIAAGNDLEVQLTANRTSQLVQRLQNNTVGGTTNARWNYHTIGMADQSGRYQQWIGSPLQARNRFDIVTPDRRITGDTPTSPGAYTCHRADNAGFLPERGLYRFSAYQWRRHAMRHNIACTSAATGLNSGTHPMLTADENSLLRAEALLRTGDAAGAATLINTTRTRAQRIGTEMHPGLPAVTAEGVPTVDGACVPRRDNGACGTLMTALRYERMLELAGYDALRSYADSRGFGMLPDGSLESFPVPGNVLEQYGLAGYTYGGVGRPGSLSYAPVD